MFVGEQPGNDTVHPRIIVCLGAHPSAILREPDPAARRNAMDALVKDLRKVKAKL